MYKSNIHQTEEEGNGHHIVLPTTLWMPRLGTSLELINLQNSVTETAIERRMLRWTGSNKYLFRARYA